MIAVDRDKIRVFHLKSRTFQLKPLTLWGEGRAKPITTAVEKPNPCTQGDRGLSQEENSFSKSQLKWHLSTCKMLHFFCKQIKDTISREHGIGSDHSCLKMCSIKLRLLLFFSCSCILILKWLVEHLSLWLLLCLFVIHNKLITSFAAQDTNVQRSKFSRVKQNSLLHL